MANPAIVYDAGAGNVSLRFSFPDTQKPGANELQPLRYDSYSLSGLRQSAFVRFDTFRPVHLEIVPFGDLAAWTTFMLFAQEGNQFHYHSDSASTNYLICELDDNQGRSSRSGQGWAPTYYDGHAAQIFATFDLNFRVVGSGTGEAVP